ncbi:hypothetical protein POM88_012508 [Heracleum sosnowskyi]|uniref:Uncharacterized protein n=1 Tax=Heracleum sosnowskyi TaxID=360622 RepID=A0AAD8N2J2_9APIA|nr:hypothetical protein POM88_012508 [Heracleum sosnowskyi]
MLVVFRRGFGRVRELWRLDMGLGHLDERFQAVEENVAIVQQVVEEEVEGMGDCDANNNDKQSQLQPPNVAVPYTIPSWSEALCHNYSFEVLKEGAIVDHFDVKRLRKNSIHQKELMVLRS